MHLLQLEPGLLVNLLPPFPAYTILWRLSYLLEKSSLRVLTLLLVIVSLAAYLLGKYPKDKSFWSFSANEIDGLTLIIMATAAPCSNNSARPASTLPNIAWRSFHLHTCPVRRAQSLQLYLRLFLTTQHSPSQQRPVSEEQFS